MHLQDQLSALPALKAPKIRVSGMDLEAEKDLSVLNRNPKLGLLGGPSATRASSSEESV